MNQNGVELVKDVDIAAFQTAVQPIYEELKTSNPTTYASWKRSAQWPKGRSVVSHSYLPCCGRCTVLPAAVWEGMSSRR